MSDRVRERDLVLAPNEFAFISDQTKGNVVVYVGPYKSSLANTDKPVVFSPERKRFQESSLDEAVTLFKTAPEGWYIVLKNPARDGNQPSVGTTNSLVPLNVGRKVNIPGPVTFALWPGQMANIVQGHHLRSNEYLVVRVYDEDEAVKNWKKAVLKTKNTQDSPETSVDAEPEMPNLTMGTQLIIKGTEVSFYIPPTGVEVVRDPVTGDYTRLAVTLERMEYCILLDESGNKRYVKGPSVVFPEPTEEFIRNEENSRKFRAIELNEISGLYIKVIAPYTEEQPVFDDQGNVVSMETLSYVEGDELFITGKDQAIYYPRPEHAIIKYGSTDRIFSIVIPEGEGRYVLERMTGVVKLVKGPRMYLPDPRQEVLVRRVIEPEKVRLWFPGNEEAYQINLNLKRQQESQGQQGPLLAKMAAPPAPSPAPGAEVKAARTREASAEKPLTESLQRGSTFTEPRQLTLDTKYQGAVFISVWTGYAVLVVNKKGERRVVQGPESTLLEYDETLQTISLSTGTPKTDARLEKTVYLRSLNNKVSDVVQVETQDFCTMDIHLSYRVNFEGDPLRWFDVENYVMFLCDHLRSVLRNFVKKQRVMDFYANAIDLVRDAVLGVPVEGGKRPGKRFAENGMVVYDLEVLGIQFGDAQIQSLLINAQHEVFKQELNLAAENRKLAHIQEVQRVNRLISQTYTETNLLNTELQQREYEKKLQEELVRLAGGLEVQSRRLETELLEKQKRDEIQTQELTTAARAESQAYEVRKRQQELRLAELKAEVDAVVSKANAISPELVAALQAFSDRALAERVAQSMAPLSILGGNSVAEVFQNLLRGTPLAQVLGSAVANGTSSPALTALPDTTP
jgi:major vault protein